MAVRWPSWACRPSYTGAYLQAQVTYLYETYLLREPESPAIITYYSDYIQTKGFTAAANEFATSPEALRLVNTGVVLPGH